MQYCKYFIILILTFIAFNFSFSLDIDNQKIQYLSKKDNSIAKSNNVTYTKDRFSIDSAFKLNGKNSEIIFSDTKSNLNLFPLSISIWIKIDSNCTKGGIIDKYEAFTGYRLYIDNGRLKAFYIKDKNSYIWDSNNGLDGGIINDNTWHHVVFNVNKKGANLYIDNELYSFLRWTGKSGASSSGNQLTIGSYTYNGEKIFTQGSIDDLRIYNKDLTVDDINSLYNDKTSIHEFAFSDNEEPETTKIIEHKANTNIKLPTLDEMKPYLSEVKESEWNNYKSYSCKLKNTTTFYIGDVEVKAKGSIAFGNEKQLSSIYDLQNSPTFQVGNRKLTFISWISFNHKGQVNFGFLNEDQSIKIGNNTIKYSVTGPDGYLQKIFFYDNGEIKSIHIKDPQTINVNGTKVNVKHHEGCGADIDFYDDGKVKAFYLDKDAKYKGIYFKSDFNHIKVYPNGNIEEIWSTDEVKVGNLYFKPNKIPISTPVKLYENANPKSGYLSRAATIDGKKYASGKYIELDEDGKVLYSY